LTQLVQLRLSLCFFEVVGVGPYISGCDDASICGGRTSGLLTFCINCCHSFGIGAGALCITFLLDQLAISLLLDPWVACCCRSQAFLVVLDFFLGFFLLFNYALHNRQGLFL